MDQDCQYNAKDDRGGQGEIEGIVFPSDQYVPGQAPEPGDLGRHHQNNPDGQEYGTEDEEKFCRSVHNGSSNN